MPLVNRWYVFKCVKAGWGGETEGVWFDAETYAREEAEAQFVPIEKMVEKNGRWVPFTFYEYGGEVYYQVEYQGEYHENDMPGMI